MQNQPQQSKPATKKPRRFIKIAIICGVILATIAVVDVFTFVGGNMRFYVRWMECGERPYSAYTPLGGYLSHYVPGPIFTIFRQNTEYYCNPLEAEKAGISASPSQYEFPTLKEQGLSPPQVGF